VVAVEGGHMLTRDHQSTTLTDHEVRAFNADFTARLVTDDS